MKTLSEVKKDLEFARGLTSLIEVLKNIAVSQYRILEQRIKAFEKFMLTIESFFELIDFSQVTHPFLVNQGKPQAVIAITSDSGLLGGLNMQVVTKAVSELEKTPGQLIVIGERGKMYAAESKLPFVAFPGIQDEQRYGQATQLRDYVMTRAIRGDFGNLKVVYPHPVSFTVQRVETISFLPFSPSAVSTGQGQAAGGTKEIILESQLDDIIEYLIYLWIGQKLYDIFGLSRLAEFAARYVHLEESLQKLKEMDSKLRLQYFRIRHELIDRNMRELFSARLLYAG
ncbi:MAG: FoF1 ATP synthase subunit gamma [Candidatus Omnitrophota bacterium]